MDQTTTPNESIYIIVHDDGSWNAYSLHKEPTARDCYLYAMLTSRELISYGDYAPGVWAFNMIKRENNHEAPVFARVDDLTIFSRIFHRF